METIFRKIVKHKNSIIFAFGISLILCFISSKFVSVNYDMNDYLPDDLVLCQYFGHKKSNFFYAALLAINSH